MNHNKFKDFYHRHMDNIILKKLLTTYRKQVRKTKKVKVVFLCQMAQLWNKIEPVYQKMQEDKKIETIIVIIPDSSVGEDGQQESIEFFNHIPGRKVLAKQGKGWISLEELRPDYVFYQRPYEDYLPEIYRSVNVASYARICYIPYAYVFSKYGDEICLSGSFFDNLYMFFAEVEHSKNVLINKDIENYQKGRKKAFNLGYPALNKILTLEQTVEKNSEKFTILWTPRWTSDPYLGRTLFFDYKDKIIDEVVTDERYALIFRPHPMMFDNFLKKGEITPSEVEQYLECFDENERLVYDTRATYYDTLWKADVLITDASTLLVEYLATCQPVIFCNTTDEFVKNEFMIEILEVCYCVDSWDEISEVLTYLSKGQDPLKEKRELFVNNVLVRKDNDAATAIVEVIKDDYYL